MLLPLAALVGASSVASANDYYLQRNQNAGWNWSTVTGNQGWFATPTGGDSIGTFDPDGTYYTNGFLLRTPESSTAATFGGAALVLNGGTLMLKGRSASATVIVDNLRSSGTATVTAGNAAHIHSFRANNFIQGGTTTFTTNVAGRGLNIAIGTLTGNGEIVLLGGSDTDKIYLGVENATGYTGTFTLRNASLLFSGNIETAGALVLDAGSHVELTHSLLVASLTINGVALADGTYSYADLRNSYGNIFSEIQGQTGQITVGAAIPEPASVALALGLGAGALALIRSRRRRSSSSKAAV